MPPSTWERLPCVVAARGPMSATATRTGSGISRVPTPRSAHRHGGGLPARCCAPCAARRRPPRPPGPAEPDPGGRRWTAAGARATRGAVVSDRFRRRRPERCVAAGLPVAVVLFRGPRIPRPRSGARRDPRGGAFMSRNEWVTSVSSWMAPACAGAGHAEAHPPAAGGAGARRRGRARDAAGELEGRRGRGGPRRRWRCEDDEGALVAVHMDHRLSGCHVDRGVWGTLEGPPSWTRPRLVIRQPSMVRGPRGQRWRLAE